VSGRGGGAFRFAALTASVYSIALIFYLWPWPADPSRLAIDNNDLLLHTWSMAFVVHQATLEPRHLFDANMFWPRPNALSYTETLFPQSAMAAPILWAGGGPLLAHNLVLFLSIVISGVTAALLSFRLTGSRAAALLAGFAYAFCPFRFQHLVQIGIASYQWFPLVLLGLWNVATGRRVRTSLALLGIAAVLQALSSGYHAVLLGFVVLAAMAFLARRLQRKGRLSLVIASLSVAAVAALIAGLPSVQLRERQAVGRGIEGPMHWSAVPRSYLDPGPNVRALGLRGLVERTPEPLFPGFMVAGLAVVGLARTRHRGARGLMLSVGIVCALMACGPVFRDLPFEWPAPFDLVRRLPPADMIRAPSRFGIGAILAIDVIASLGFATLERGVARNRRVLLFVCGLAFMAVELRPSIAHAIKPIPPPPAYTAALASLPRASLIEIPWASEEAAGRQLYWSTAHWQPLISGYGGFSVPDNFALAAMAQNFPTGFAARVLRCAGVRYAVVHGAEVPDAQVQRAMEFDLKGVNRLGRFGSDFLFSLDAWDSSVPCAPEIPKDFRRTNAS